LFVHAVARKMLNFPLEVVFGGHLIFICGSSEYAVRVMGLVSFSVHCIANNLVLEIYEK